MVHLPCVYLHASVGRKPAVWREKGLLTHASLKYYVEPQGSSLIFTAAVSATADHCAVVKLTSTLWISETLWVRNEL